MKLKSVFFFLFFFVISIAHSMEIRCVGKTNDVSASENAKFELEIKTDKNPIFRDMGVFYRSTIKYFYSKNTSYTGIDLSEKISTYLNKIVFKGSIANKRNLTFEFDQNNSIKSAVLNYDSKIINQPVECEIDGNMPMRPSCPIDSEKQAYLLKAINASDLDIIQTAIDCGANVNQADSNGCTPIMYTVEPTCGKNESRTYRSLLSKTPQILDLLTSNGAFVDTVDSRKETALIKAAKMGVTDVYETFIGLEANFDSQDEVGNTALMYAVESGDKRVVEQVLEGNPDRKIKNNAGNTALDLAKILQRSEIVDLVRIADVAIVIEGKSNGACVPEKVNLKQGQVVDLTLKATDKMFKLTAPNLGIEMMADRNGLTKKTIVFDKKGNFKFSCGFHGVGKPTLGSFEIE